jgi:murein DD-endopeptidase MepM/ murein hydrolase activator NlpD
MERRFAQVQVMLGASNPTVVREPQPVVPAPAPVKVDTVTPTLPTTWPLDVEGHVTRGNGGATEYNGPHPGLDVAVPVGTPIRAAGGGTVVEVGDDARYGRFVRIEHRDGYESLYAHASDILVKKGDKVAAGHTIARSGNTGQSTAPHLHFEVRQGGAAVDPMLLITRKKE